MLELIMELEGQLWMVEQTPDGEELAMRQATENEISDYLGHTDEREGR